MNCREIYAEARRVRKNLFVILNGVKDLLFAILLRPVQSANRSFVPQDDKPFKTSTQLKRLINWEFSYCRSDNLRLYFFHPFNVFGWNGIVLGLKHLHKVFLAFKTYFMANLRDC